MFAGPAPQLRESRPSRAAPSLEGAGGAGRSPRGPRPGRGVAERGGERPGPAPPRARGRFPSRPRRAPAPAAEAGPAAGTAPLLPGAFPASPVRSRLSSLFLFPPNKSAVARRVSLLARPVSTEVARQRSTTKPEGRLGRLQTQQQESRRFWASVPAPSHGVAWQLEVPGGFQQRNSMDQENCAALDSGDL